MPTTLSRSLGSLLGGLLGQLLGGLLGQLLGSLPTSLVRRMPTIWASWQPSHFFGAEDADDLGRSLEISSKSRGDAALF